MRNIIVCSLLTCCAMIIGGCDSDPSTSPQTRQTAMLAGRVVLHDGCDPLNDHSGVLVRSDLGSTLSNSEGYYEIKVPTWQTFVTLTKDGFYRSESNPPSWNTDSAKFIEHYSRSLFKLSNYSARIVKEPEVSTRTQVIQTQSEVIDSNGVRVYKYEYDTITYKVYSVSVIPLDSVDQLTALAYPYLFVSNESGIDPFDKRTFKAYFEGQGFTYPMVFTLTDNELSARGLDTEKPLYVTATSKEICYPYESWGVRHSEEKRIDPR